MNATTPSTESGPLHARFDGPIVMIGFGSIGKGTLPLIERHIAFDRAKFVVIAPDDSDRRLLDERQIRFIHRALTKENYRDILTPLLTTGPGRGMVVNLSVDTSSVDLMEFCKDLDTFFRAQDTRLVLFEFGSDKSFGIDQRLLAHIVSRNHAQLSVVDLDIVAKDLVKPDFEPGNACTFAFTGFQRDNPAARVPNRGD